MATVRKLDLGPPAREANSLAGKKGTREALAELSAEAAEWLAGVEYGEVTITKKAGILNLLKSVTRRVETE